MSNEEMKLVWQFLGMAIDQEHQAICEGERDETSYADLLKDSQLLSNRTYMTLRLKSGKNFRISVIPE